MDGVYERVCREIVRKVSLDLWENDDNYRSTIEQSGVRMGCGRTEVFRRQKILAKIQEETGSSKAERVIDGECENITFLIQLIDKFDVELPPDTETMFEGRMYENTQKFLNRLDDEV